MKYDFDKIEDRSNNQAIKLDVLELEFGKKDLIPLWVADMDFRTADPIVKALQKRADQGIYGYTTMIDDFYKAFQAWVSSKYNWKIDQSDLLFSPAVVISIILIIKALTNEGDKIIIQTPVYGPFKRSIEEHKRVTVTNPMKGLAVDYDDLDEKMKDAKMMILCNPHNPIGKCYSEDELKQIIKLAKKNNVILLSDEIHSDLILNGNKHVPIAGLGQKENIVTMMSPSKTFNLAGLQSSIIVCEDKKLMNPIRETFRKMDINLNNSFGQVAFIAAYNEGQDWLDQLLKYIEGNMDFVIEYMKVNIPEIKINKPQGTYLLWLDCRGLKLEHAALEEFMVHEAGIAFTSGTFFGTEGSGFMRMNVACSRKVLAKALEQLLKAVEGIR